MSSLSVKIRLKYKKNHPQETCKWDNTAVYGVPRGIQTPDHVGLILYYPKFLWFNLKEEVFQVKNLMRDLFPRPRLTPGALFVASSAAVAPAPWHRCRYTYAMPRLN